MTFKFRELLGDSEICEILMSNDGFSIVQGNPNMTRHRPSGLVVVSYSGFAREPPVNQKTRNFGQ